MNLQQLEYIVAIDQERHFTQAAQKCFVTQATLSMMVKKLEDELGMKIFDRSRLPVTVTAEGQLIIEHARKILQDVTMLQESAQELRGEHIGEVRIGVIPTLAPYLLPLFLKSLSVNHPRLRVTIRELITNRIITELQHGNLDIGLVATPLHEPTLEEFPLFYEEFYAYASKTENLPTKKYLLPKHINPEHLWLLEEGHCMRNQLFNLCALRIKEDTQGTLNYEAGSIETLINLVDRSGGITVIPQLATTRLNAAQGKKLREFAPPKPVREISLVVRRNFPRRKMMSYIRDEIIKGVRKYVLLDEKGLKIVELVNGDR